MRLTTGRLLAPASFLAAGLLVVSVGGAVGQPGQEKAPDKDKRDKDQAPKGDPAKQAQEAAAKDLQNAFDGITDLAQAVPAGKEATQMFDNAKAFYREAVKAYPTDSGRARELAGAVNDAVRGLTHLRRSSSQPVPGLPEPPAAPDAARPANDGSTGKAGPWSPALDALNNIREQITSGGALTKGTSKEFFEAANTAYRQGRRAYEGGDYRKAGELAQAADAWLRVSARLDRVGWDGTGAPLPLSPDQKKGTPPPPPVKE